MTKPMPMLPLLVLLAVLAGCGQDDVARVREGGAPAVAADGDAPVFDAEIVLCRRVGSKTGRRFDVGDSFVENADPRDSHVYGFVDFSHAPAGVHQVHLVWLKPGGEELFRKFAEVRVAPGPEGWTTEVAWLKAEDLGYRRAEEPVAGADADFSLDSRIEMSPERERDAGEYALRVYWNRELLLEKTFSFGRADG